MFRVNDAVHLLQRCFAVCCIYAWQAGQRQKMPAWRLPIVSAPSLFLVILVSMWVKLC